MSVWSSRPTDVVMPAFGGADQPGAVEAVEAVDVGTVVQGQLQQVEVPLAGGDEVRALLRVVLRVHVRSGVDQ